MAMNVFFVEVGIVMGMAYGPLLGMFNGDLIKKVTMLVFA